MIWQPPRALRSIWPYRQGDVDGCAREHGDRRRVRWRRELGRRARGGYDNANLWIGPELRESDDWHDFLQSAYTGIDALEQADKSVDALVQAVAADKPEVVVDLGDISRRLHELAENLNSSLMVPMNTTCIRCRSIAGCVPAESQ